MQLPSWHVEKVVLILKKSSHSVSEDLAGREPVDLLRLHSDIIRELKNRGIVRSSNNPLGDYTEWLVSSRLGLTLEHNSKAGYDGVDSEGVRYQIKGRRIEAESNSIRLSTIRNLDDKTFDFLIAVVFDGEYEVRQAIKIPHAIVASNVYFQRHVNGHVFYLRPNILEEPDVVDITHQLSEALSG